MYRWEEYRMTVESIYFPSTLNNIIHQNNVGRGAYEDYEPESGP